MGGKKIGVDLGGTVIKMGIVEEGSVSEEMVFDTPVSEGYGAVLDCIAEGLGKLLAHCPEADCIGMGVPGLIDSRQGTVCYSNNLGWENVSFVQDMEKKLSMEQRAVKVKIANDAQCAALGEALYGAGRGYGRMAMFTIGTGVGGGFIRDGKPESDRYGSMAYIFGHEALESKGRMCNCGRQGCLEAYASAEAVKKRSVSLYETPQSAKEIFEKAREGDVRAQCLVEELLEYLSRGAVNISNILRPEVIVIGGGVSASADLILPRLQEELKKGVYGYAYAPVTAVCAELKNQAGTVGAAYL
ncbi:MAG: ROK family protein [Lachnospiraceae bacterium]|nr:ROK family protein [Lachnospiraceae bacterium]